nr:hypothetical protein StreXyl84_06710 [Streptomyces sp. Xyl84]
MARDSGFPALVTVPCKEPCGPEDAVTGNPIRARATPADTAAAVPERHRGSFLPPAVRPCRRAVLRERGVSGSMVGPFVMVVTVRCRCRWPAS